jgi:hypothetical protein
VTLFNTVANGALEPSKYGSFAEVAMVLGWSRSDDRARPREKKSTFDNLSQQLGG